jgi:nicotinate-nucleotide adenylyltransferase
MNIGLYFGSFNPIHTGHLVIAQHMASHHGLDEVWFVVTPHNPMKQAADLAPESDRLEMVKLAVSDNPRLKAVDVEFGLPRPNYTAHTMDFLVRRHPDTTFKIIIGEDNLRTLQQWARWRELVDRYGFLVYPRAYAEGEAKNLEGTIAIDGEHIVLSPAPVISISSTYLRTALASGDSARYLLPDAAAGLIRERGLYGFPKGD